MACGCFFTVPWVDLKCMIVAFPGHTQFLFNNAYMFPLETKEILPNPKQFGSDDLDKNTVII